MFNLDNLVSGAKDAMKKLDPKNLNDSANKLKDLCTTAYSELTNNVSLLQGIDTDKPVNTGDSKLGSLIEKIKTSAMSEILKMGEDSMTQGILKQLSGALDKKSSSLFDLLPGLISGFDKLKGMFSGKSDNKNASNLVEDLLSKAKPVLDLLKLVK